MVRRGEILDDTMEDEFYLRRLDAGLFVLQLICYIMVEMSSAGIPQVCKNQKEIVKSGQSFHGEKQVNNSLLQEKCNIWESICEPISCYLLSE